MTCTRAIYVPDKPRPPSLKSLAFHSLDLDDMLKMVVSFMFTCSIHLSGIPRPPTLKSLVLHSLDLGDMPKLVQLKSKCKDIQSIKILTLEVERDDMLNWTHTK